MTQTARRAEGMTVAVTGASGYVGGRLLGVLTARPGTGQPRTTVRVLTRRPRRWPEGVVEVVGDLTDDPAVVARLSDGADALIHLAGPNEVAAADDPAGTVHDLGAAAFAVAHASVPRVAYLSTVHVYGARLRPGEVIDEDTPCEPRAAYAIGRLAAEHIITAYAPGDVVVLRLTNSVGAPASPAVDRWSLVANDLCRQGVTTGVLRLKTDGTQWRDFVPLTDVCRVIAATATGALAPGTYNLGSGQPLTVRGMAALIQERFAALGLPRPRLQALDPRPDPPGPPLVSVAKLAEAGWRASGALADAVDDTIRLCHTMTEGGRR